VEGLEAGPARSGRGSNKLLLNRDPKGLVMETKNEGILSNCEKRGQQYQQAERMEEGSSEHGRLWKTTRENPNVCEERKRKQQ